MAVGQRRKPKEPITPLSIGAVAKSDATRLLVRVQRPGCLAVVMRVDMDRLPELMARAAKDFGTPNP